MQETTKKNLKIEKQNTQKYSTQFNYTNYRSMFNLNKHASDPWITENNRL